MNTLRFRLLTLAALALATSSTAFAQATITHDKALAGSVTPGDTAGYPVTISHPGHYKLTSNLYVPANTTGILINAAGVTLDLNGFSVIGPNSCTMDNSTFALTCQQALDTSGASPIGILAIQPGVIRNGFVLGFNKYCVRVTAGKSAAVQNVHASHCPGFGIAIADGRVSDSHAELVGMGIATDITGTVTNSRVARVGNGSGIAAGYAAMAAAMIENSSATETQGIAFGGAVRGSLARANKGGIGNATSLGGNFNGNTNTPF